MGNCSSSVPTRTVKVPMRGRSEREVERMSLSLSYATIRPERGT